MILLLGWVRATGWRHVLPRNRRRKRSRLVNVGRGAATQRFLELNNIVLGVVVQDQGSHQKVQKHRSMAITSTLCKAVNGARSGHIAALAEVSIVSCC
jgi:hypothetical protein